MPSLSAATDLFHGKESLATTIWKAIVSANATVKALGQQHGQTPIDFFKQLTRQELLRILYINNLSLQDVMVPDWTEVKKKSWTQIMTERGGVVMKGSDGSAGEAEVALELFVRLEALDEVCAQPQVASAEQQNKIRALRDKYRAAHA